MTSSVHGTQNSPNVKPAKCKTRQMPFMAILPNFMPASISAIWYSSMYKGLHGEGGLRDGHMWQNPMQPWWLHIIVFSLLYNIHTYTRTKHMLHVECSQMHMHTHVCTSTIPVVPMSTCVRTYVHHKHLPQQCSKEALDAGTHSMANLSLEY